MEATTYQYTYELMWFKSDQFPLSVDKGSKEDELLRTTKIKYTEAVDRFLQEHDLFLFLRQIGGLQWWIENIAVKEWDATLKDFQKYELLQESESSIVTTCITKDGKRGHNDRLIGTLPSPVMNLILASGVLMMESEYEDAGVEP